VPRIRAMMGDRVPRWPTVIDPSAYAVTKANPVAVAEQFRLSGLPVMPGLKTTKHGEWHGIQLVKERLRRDDLLVTDTCRHTIREFRTWKVKKDKQHRPLESDALEDRNNDALDALRYLVTLHPTYAHPKVEVHTAPDW